MGNLHSPNRSDYDVISIDRTLVYLLEKSTRKQHLLKTIPIDTAASLHRTKLMIEQKKRHLHQHITLLKDYQVNDDGSISVLYEFPFRTLQDEKTERIIEAVPFQTNELWSILASLILAFAYLQKNGVKNETVRADNIYLEDSGVIKISDPWVKELETNYIAASRACESTNSQVYLSPREIESLRQNLPAPVHDPYKSDVFTLGIVMLDIALLKTQDHVYKNGVNKEGLKESLDECERKYGPDLTSIIAIMTEFDETSRLDWIELEGFVKKSETVADQPQPLVSQPIQYPQGTSSTHTNPVYQTVTAAPAVSSSYYPPPHMVSVPIQPRGKPTTQSQMLTQQLPPQQAYTAVQSQLHLVQSGTYQPQMSRYKTTSFVATAPAVSPPSPSSSQHSGVYAPPPKQLLNQQRNMNVLQYPQKQQQPAQYIQQRQVLPQKQGAAYPGYPAYSPSAADVGGKLHNSQHQALAQQQQHQHSVSQQGFHPQAQYLRQQQTNSPVKQAVYNNRIMATNINRERRSPSPVMMPSQFAKKVAVPQQNMASSSHQQSHQTQRANSVTPLPVSFSFQGQPNQKAQPQQRIMTAENKRIVQKEPKLNQKLSPVNALLNMEQQQPMSNLDLGNLFQKKQPTGSPVPSTIPKPPAPPVIPSSPPGPASIIPSQTPSPSSKPPSSSNINPINPTNRSPIIPTVDPYPNSASSFGTIMQKLQQKPSITETVQDSIVSQFREERRVEPLPVKFSEPKIEEGEDYDIRGVFREEEDGSKLNRLEQFSKVSEKMNELKQEEISYSAAGSNYDSLLKKYSEIKNNMSKVSEKHDTSKVSDKYEDHFFSKPKVSPKREQHDDWKAPQHQQQVHAVSVEVQTTPFASQVKRQSGQSRATSGRITQINYAREDKYASTSTLNRKQQTPTPAPPPAPKIKVQPKYEGETLKGFRHGYGKYTFEDGSYYDGNWNFNRMQGKGKLFYASGKLAYDGNWSQDQIHGYGKLYNENPRHIDTVDYKDFSKVENYWQSYEGNFEYDQKNGRGTLTFQNGETFTGNFQGDKINGEGVFKSKTSRTIHGVWQRNHLSSVL